MMARNICILFQNIAKIAKLPFHHIFQLLLVFQLFQVHITWTRVFLVLRVPDHVQHLLDHVQYILDHVQLSNTSPTISTTSPTMSNCPGKVGIKSC